VSLSFVNELWCGNDNREKGMVRDGEGMVRGSWKGGEWKGDGKGKEMGRE
jgi:hypothetical protein